MKPLSSVELLAISPVIPVVVVPDVHSAAPIARALAEGGVGVIEVTLRTEAGVDAIRRISAEVPEIVVGAGTVTTPDQVEMVRQAGADFIVLPGSPDHLLDAALDCGLPLLPGAATLTEMMNLAERGQTVLKFFPAEQSGGRGYLSAVAGPLPGLRFCPTGGVNPGNAGEYLSLGNVGCVGGSWLTPTQAIMQQDWEQIRRLANEASSLRVPN